MTPPSPAGPRLFLLSPAHLGGKRADLLLGGRGRFALAERLRSGERVPLGEAFSFLSGLYFRGKLTYANRYAAAPAGVAGVHVITSNRGLVPADTRVTADELRGFADTEIRADEPRYRDPLRQTVSALDAAARASRAIVLLGSIATGKYVDVLLETLGERLLFPGDFVGRGDMSRGALLLRAAREGRELEYRPVADAVRRGPRPPSLRPSHGDRDPRPTRPRRTANSCAR
jgi:hypothetical protein